MTDASIDEWPAKYRRECLGDRAAELLEVSSPLRVLRVSARTPDGVAMEVDHFLLRLPRRH